MSATRDKSQKIAFVYRNLYEIYRKGKQGESNSTNRMPHIIKVGQTNPVQEGLRPGLRVHAFKPMEIRKKSSPSRVTLNGLKTNIDELKDLHSRLRFTLGELESLLKKKK